MVLAVALLAGCEPTCEEVCDKLLACDGIGTERVSAAECEEQCNEQQELYATWTDTQRRATFQDHLSCLSDSECADIGVGVCYDEDVFSF